MRRCKSIVAEVDVDVDLSDWSDDELEEELRQRCIERSAHPGSTAQLAALRLWEAVLSGNESERDRFMRELIYIHTGRMLP